MKVKLKELGKISTGNTPSKNVAEFYDSEDIGFVKPDVISDSQVDYIENTMEYLSEMARNKARIVKKDAVFVTCVGSIGKIGIAQNKEFAFNQQINAIEPNEKVLPQYLAYGIFANKRKLHAIANAPVVPIINKTQFGDFEIEIIDDIQEQLMIVKVLDKVSEIIANRKAELEKLDELIKARFVEMFGDPVSNPKGLIERTLPELGEFGRGVSKHRPRNDEALLGGVYPLIQTGDVANSGLYITEYHSTYSELGLRQSKMWNEGTLCITIAANIAKTAILGFDACFPDSVVGFNANENTNNVFVHYWFSFFQEILESQAPESAQKNINLKILSELKVIVPDIQEQKEFVAFVVQVNKSKAAVQKALNQTQLLFDSLMQEYFG